MVDELLSRYSPAMYLVVLTSYCVFFAAEWLYPAKRPSVRGFATNIGYSVVFFAVGPLFSIVPAVYVNKLAALYGPLLNVHLKYWPLAIVPVFLTDFFYYWFHRAQHRFLWFQHRLHHADEHLCAATAYRHNPLEDAFKAVLLVLPMSLLFRISTVESAALGFIAAQWGYFIHANLRLRLPVGWLVVGPQAHRIHHSIEDRHRDKNFAAFFPVIDMLFGTYYAPKRGEYPDTGVSAEQNSLAYTR